MKGGCELSSLQLKVANIYIRLYGDRVEVGISPVWNTTGRHEYVVVGTIDDVINELKQLVEDILKAIKALEYMVGWVRGCNES
jgi:hypothetical protein